MEYEIIHILASFFLAAGIVLSVFVVAVLLFINYKIHQADNVQYRISSRERRQIIAAIAEDIEKMYMGKKKKEALKNIVSARVKNGVMS